MAGRRARAPLGAAVAMLLALGVPGFAAASTEPEPSLSPCDLPSSTAVAGTPLVLSGAASSPAADVGVMARSDVGGFREGAVTILGERWQAVLVFGTADWGSWTVEESVDGVRCASRLTVAVPAGVVAPSRAVEPAPDPALGSARNAIDLETAAAIAVAVTVLASYVLLAAVAIVSVLGRRPLRRAAVRLPARAAAFCAVLGTLSGATVVTTIAWSFSHFDTGLSPDESAIAKIAVWASVVIGSALGVIAARRVPNGASARPI